VANDGTDMDVVLHNEPDLLPLDDLLTGADAAACRPCALRRVVPARCALQRATTST
jgi:hypothetical protein